ncbi:hypothetical protein H0H93_010604 [Arthromyces matolae]|nr:hypothetical protein H0H93_010604 [Arthromyces matolae]
MSSVNEPSPRENKLEALLNLASESQIILEGQISKQQESHEALASSGLPGTTLSPARGPRTRSQTGTLTKRRRSPSPEPYRQKSIRASKKSKLTSDRSENSMIIPPSKDATIVHPLPARQISAPQRDETSEPQNNDTMDTPINQPSTRLRANLPVPVPNLTKKSRGRRVPTTFADDNGNSANPKDATRIYVCKVENCGKCFHRGEHLKRHIRSIHTNEKPFKCTYASCNKTFNRHDNLLQHLKVHRDLAPSETSTADDIGSPVELRKRSKSPLSVERSPSQLQPYYPPHNSSHKESKSSAQYQPTPSYRPYDTSGSYATLSEPVTFRTNMAVSSIRTEIPQSPS